MSNARTYYDSLIQQGYTAEQASQYTKQYYPEFSINAPQAPIPPALLTAAASAGGQAPAIGAIIMGKASSYSSRNLFVFSSYFMLRKQPSRLSSI